MAQGKSDEVRNLFDELGKLLECDGSCSRRCVFPEIGEGAGCPLNEFEDRVMDAIGGNDDRDD